jgi:cytoskeleton protein RodZ
MTLLSQLNAPGTQKVVEGAPPFSVIIGNAANVRVTYRDAPFDLRP